MFMRACCHDGNTSFDENPALLRAAAEPDMS